MELTAEQVRQQIERAAQQASPRLRKVAVIQPGEAIRQGDIYVVRIAKAPKQVGMLTANRQLAPGQTRGSRHVVEGELKVYEAPERGSPLEGPVVVATKAFRVTHPEHAHFELPAGTYRVLYQRDFSREELERVYD